MRKNKKYYKEFEFEFKTNSKLNFINEFLNTKIENKYINLLSINENIFFNKEKKKFSRIILYYELIEIKLNHYNIIRIHINTSKNEINENLNKFNKIFNENMKKNNIKLINTSTNHYIENSKLNVRVSYFINIIKDDKL